jgi:general secretion pathway protein A
MDYFSVLNLNKEPFSNSPDPDFFYHSGEHVSCLQKLELSLLLRRGLNVIIGEVGTGKTTLCRQLIRRFSKREEVQTHLILDPHFVDANEFLITVASMLTGKKPLKGSNNWQVKEFIKQYLYKAGVEEEQVTVLIIDEGQKIPVFCLEILREFLNYETNEFKLLQIVIFAQTEFEKIIQKHPNFADRINLYHYLRPLTFRDTRKMIKFRLEQSRGSRRRLDLFTLPALAAVYRATGGFPRKIINLCHQAILAMIIQNRSSIGYFLVRSCIHRVFHDEPKRKNKLLVTAVTTACIAAVLVFLVTFNPLKAYLPWDVTSIMAAFSPQKKVPTANKDQTGSTFAAISQVQEPPAGIQPPPHSGTVSDSKPVAEESAVLDAEPAAEVQAEKAEPPEPEILAAVDSESEILADGMPSEETYNEILGRVTLQRNDSLSRIIQKVYGSYNSRYFKSLILANPKIEDPDRVHVGLSIDLPAIPAEFKPPAREAWWIQIIEKGSLEDAFDFMRAYTQEDHPVRLIPYWSRQAGLIFSVALKGYFADEEKAQRQLKELPPGISAQGEVISLWDEDRTYFANPFSGGRNN